jgi:diguanylate cyclase (GGDEF)-like protein
VPDETGVALTSILWTLWLDTGIYVLACAIQLHFMAVSLKRYSHDALTGALSRRSGIEAIDLLFSIANRQDAPLSVLFLDVDDFKSINDTYGHQAGDQALKDIAAKLQSLVRAGDVVIRWGGEEFLVLLTNTPINGAAYVIDRIMKYWLGSRPEGAPITASIGLAERKADGATDFSQLIAIADKRMYVAKTSGKATWVGHEKDLGRHSLRGAVLRMTEIHTPIARRSRPARSELA